MLHEFPGVTYSSDNHFVFSCKFDNISKVSFKQSSDHADTSPGSKFKEDSQAGILFFSVSSQKKLQFVILNKLQLKLA